MKEFIAHPITATVLKIVFSAGLLTGLIYYIDLASVYQSLLNANVLYLAVGLGLAAAQLLIHFFRWRYLLRLVSREITDSEVVTSLFVGFMAGFFTPSQIGELAGRIASHPTVNRSHIIGITLIDKLYWTALTFIIGGLGLTLFVANHLIEYWNPLYQYLTAAGIFLLTALFLLPERVKTLLQLLPEKIRLHRYYEMIKVLDDKFHNTQGSILFGSTLLLYIAILLEYYFLAMAFGPVSFFDAILCGASVFFVKAVIFPAAFGDLGVRESAAVFFFEKAGSTAAIAFNASIVMSFANVIIPTAVGAVMVTRLKRR